MATPVRQLFNDIVRTVTGGALGPSDPPDGVEQVIPAVGFPLMQYAETARFYELDRRESYFRKQQHAGKPYDWNGNLMGYDNEGPLPVGYVVPYAKRQPCVRANTAAKIVRRFTAMLFGQDHFPGIKVEGDEDAEAYVKALSTESKLPLKMHEGRDLGGAIGTSVFSARFVDGKPRVSIHNAKHCTVLEWADRDQRVPRSVLETYSYVKQVYDPQTRRVLDATYYYVRHWDETTDTTWAPILRRIAMLPNWASVTPIEQQYRHRWPRCPVYWVQNAPDTVHDDGVGDYEGLERNCDEIDETLSANAAGTKANVDPTLVILADQATAPLTPVRKGSGQAIFSPGGAQYLELKGEASRAARETAKGITDTTLEAAECVIMDPEKITGNAQSGRALQMLFAPMTSRADIYRAQYGDHAIIPILTDMLKAAKQLEAEGEAVILPKRKRKKEKPPAPAPEMGERVVESPPEPPETELVDHSPGESEEIALNWPPYFPVAWPDIAQAVTAAMAANGGKPIVSQKTTTTALASMFGVVDPDAELHEIEMDSEKVMDKQARQMAMMPPPPEPEGGPPQPKETK